MAKQESRYIIETLIKEEWQRTSIASSKESAINTCKEAMLCDAWAQRDWPVKEHTAFRVKDTNTDCVMYNTDRDTDIISRWSSIAYGGSIANAMKYNV